MPNPRLLFCSYHSYLDLSSGAALSTRHLLELLAERGWACAVVCGPRLDFEPRIPYAEVLRQQGLSAQVERAHAGALSFTLHHLTCRGVPITLFEPEGQTDPRRPTREEGNAFLGLFEHVRRVFHPDVLLTYGGHWLGRALIAAAKHAGLRVVFSLRNFAYTDAKLFAPIDAVLVPSEYSREHYQRTLGIESTAIPGPWDPNQVRCDAVDGRFVTFVNPQPAKGVFVFARIVLELSRRRPDIPFLVVEGRAAIDWLGRTGLDLSGVTTVHRMANTPDPRAFYRVSRLVLMPSLWRESFGRVVAEALMNGIPVLASRRGALPEILADAGVLPDIPEQYTSETRMAPTAEEVAPWLEAIERLWDDSAAYEQESERCLKAAEKWGPERLLPRFEAFFRGVAGGEQEERKGHVIAP
jgi:glycosyltransferase involved in cell wall biosynthesis